MAARRCPCSSLRRPKARALSSSSSSLFYIHQATPLISNTALFLSALDSIRKRPRLALRFFRWAELQPGFPRCEMAFVGVLEILADSDLTRAAYAVMERVLALGLHGILDLLIQGRFIPGTRWQSARFPLFTGWCAVGSSSDVKNCNREDNAQDALELLGKMLNKGFSFNDVTYNVLINATRIVGELQLGSASEAFKLGEEMIARGITPDTVSYNVQIDGLCKMGNIDEAYNLLLKMVKDGKRGLSPNKYTYTLLINEHCNREIGNEALRLYGEMHEKGVQPDSCAQSVLSQTIGEEHKDHAISYLENLHQLFAQISTVEAYTIAVPFCFPAEDCLAQVIFSPLTGITEQACIEGLINLHEAGPTIRH
ncbi:pentatricopeptide repeat-containing protein At1g22960, mitochondrial-like [Dioscorea cayenensis subsp. rotundata]|uniref:Pentatricopeptide repeat-containing protein At1g22960, mitochondrial-like n=1 Tax=Dioscorea cayennensis subsp. rotundata TaxID=55577 RepID=A0AB40ASL8_DIOCR|nr:pentatricopeptide repeat-containing protein At1g22960, mitochondrial-like [Dioscorea cayenensis subsp. rotundata]